MKRIYAIILILVLSLALISCDDKKVSSNNIKEDNEVSSESDNKSNSDNEKNTDELNENKNHVKEASSNSDAANNSTSDNCSDSNSNASSTSNNSSSSNKNAVNNSNNSNYSNNNSVSNKNTSTKKDSQNANKEVSNYKNEESFYGQWVIKKVAGYSKVSGGRDTSLVINTKISLSKDLAIFDKDSFKNPKYIINNEKKDDLEYDYRTNFSKLGINEDSITTIIVKSEDSSFEDKLFVKDNNTLIYCDEGVFYDVERI